MIYCCKDCVPPKRHPGCHIHCPEYAKEKEKHDEQKAAEDHVKAIGYGITAQRSDSVRRVIKRKGISR